MRYRIWLSLAGVAFATALTGCTVSVTPDNITVTPESNRDEVVAAVREAALLHRVPVDLAMSIAQLESNFRCDALSSTGAIGPLQIMAGTAAKYGVSRDDLTDCNTAIDAGMQELKSCYENNNRSWALTAVCYNAGPAAVSWRALPRETVNYQRNLIRMK